MPRPLSHSGTNSSNALLSFQYFTIHFTPTAQSTTPTAKSPSFNTDAISIVIKEAASTPAAINAAPLKSSPPSASLAESLFCILIPEKNVQLLFCPEMIEKIYRLIYNWRGTFIMEK
jgi:hypothetical protein